MERLPSGLECRGKHEMDDRKRSKGSGQPRKVRFRTMIYLSAHGRTGAETIPAHSPVIRKGRGARSGEEMELKARIQDPARPVIFYELIPPKAGASAELETQLQLVRDLSETVDAINIPEIIEESRQGERRARLPKRIEPRVFARAIQEAVGMETVVNRVTVRETAERQRDWFQETYERYGVRNVILVGGEAAAIEYPGPSVLEAGDLASATGLDFFLGGIAIPSRSREAARIRSKYEHGLRFFTTQVLVDPNDTVDLLQTLNGLDVRIFLSFAPITNLRDVEFLEWLGVDVPRNVAWGVEQAGGPAQAAEKMTAMASRVLTDIFDNLPSHPPALGMNVEQITRRTHAAARRMLTELSGVYPRYVRMREVVSRGSGT